MRKLHYEPRTGRFQLRYHSGKVWQHVLQEFAEGIGAAQGRQWPRRRQEDEAVRGLVRGGPEGILRGVFSCNREGEPLQGEDGEERGGAAEMWSIQ